MIEKSLAQAAPEERPVKLRPRDGCGDRFPRGDLVEVGPEQLAFGYGIAEGERYCQKCAHKHGIR